MLGVVYHMEKWRCYLDGVHFTVVTDHQPNTWFASQKQLSPRQARWYEKLRGFDFTWEYRPGRLNAADPLSRNPAYCNVIMASCLNESPAALCFVMGMNLRSKGPPAKIPVQVQDKKRKWDMRGMLEQAHSMRWGGEQGKTPAAPAANATNKASDPARVSSGKRLKQAHIAKAQRDAEQRDAGLSRAYKTPTAEAQQRDAVLPNPGAAQPMQEQVYAPQVIASSKQHGQAQQVVQPDQVMHNTARDGRHVRDADNRDDIQHMQGAQADTQAQEQDQGTLAQQQGLTGLAPLQTPVCNPLQLLQLIKDSYHADPLYSSDHAAEGRRQKLGIVAQGELFKRGAAIAIPDAAQLRASITSELHCSPYAGHIGMNRTLALIARYFYWPDMQADINDYVRGCVLC